MRRMSWRHPSFSLIVSAPRGHRLCRLVLDNVHQVVFIHGTLARSLWGAINSSRLIRPAPSFKQDAVFHFFNFVPHSVNHIDDSGPRK